VSASPSVPALKVNGRPTVNLTESDPFIVALARYVEALHRRYPEGPEQMRREGLDGRANITGMHPPMDETAA
jgi:hypothetical protein